jgi:hypothetical protein
MGIELGSSVSYSLSHASFNVVKIGFFFLSLLLRVLCSNRFRFLPSADSGRNASLEDTRKGAALVGGGGDASVSVASAAVGSRGEARAKEDDATGGAAGLPPVSSEEPANSTQESGVLSS